MNKTGTSSTGDLSDLPLEQQSLIAGHCTDSACRHLDIPVRGSAWVAEIVDTNLERDRA